MFIKKRPSPHTKRKKKKNTRHPGSVW